jgi:CRP/FNR family transcriptional regulator, anaerobic regulatory protein
MTSHLPTADSASATILSALQFDLPDPLRLGLAQLRVVECAAGDAVFDAHQRCGGFPLLLSGEICVFRPLANGRSIELYRVAPSEPCILSLGCLLGGGLYPACGVAARPTRMLVMPPPMFEEWMASVVPFRTAMFRLLGERLVSVMELVEEVVTLRLDTRLAAALLAQVQRGADTASIAVTHQQLADGLGTVREMVSRVLDGFARQGLVALTRGRVELLSVQRLRALAQLR